jgi:hypothetical protein
MHPAKHTVWQLVTLNRLSKAAGVVKRNTTPDLSRTPSSLQWLEWSAAMVQSMAFGLDPMLVIEASK